MEFNYTI